MNWELLFELSFVIIAIVICLAVIVVLLTPQSPPTTWQGENALCVEHLPSEEWEVTASFEGISPLDADLTCYYETKAEFEYDVCFIFFHETHNHGFMLSGSCDRKGAS